MDYNGAPFHDYDSMIRYLRGVSARKRDMMVVVHGPEGAGKTTVGFTIILDLKPAFDIEADVIMDMDDLIDRIGDGGVGEPKLVDEGANVFFNQDWNTVEAKETMRILRMARIKKWVWVVHIPDFEALNNYIREHRCRIRIYVPPYDEADGPTNGPAMVLWRTERFDYNEGRVVHRWQHVYDLEVESLDDHEKWNGHDQRKHEAVDALVKSLKKRRKAKKAKAEK